MFEGMLTALVTPFRDDEVDEAALRELVERQMVAGVDGLVPCGSTGESATLSHVEHQPRGGDRGLDAARPVAFRSSPAPAPTIHPRGC